MSQLVYLLDRLFAEQFIFNVLIYLLAHVRVGLFKLLAGTVSGLLADQRYELLRLQVV